jgi:hypothetical protein
MWEERSWAMSTKTILMHWQFIRSPTLTILSVSKKFLHGIMTERKVLLKIAIKMTSLHKR